MKRIPNFLSATRIFLAPVFVVMYLQDDIVWVALSVAVFAIAALTDYFDGYIARNFEAGSKLGVFLDPLGDKFLTIAGFICLPFVDSQFYWWVIGLILFRDIFVTLLRLYTERKGVMMETSVLAKVKTFVQMIFLYITLFAGVFLKADVTVTQWSIAFFESGIPGIVLYLVMIITVYTGLEYIVTNRKQLFGNKTS